MKTRTTIVNCRRCNKPISTAIPSLYGLDAFKRKSGGICYDCITQDMLHGANVLIGQGIANKKR